MDALPMIWAFRIDVLLGPEQMLGRTAEGDRIDYPIVGGTFAGIDFKGDVVSGGADNFLLRDDGVGVLDAVYQLRTNDGVLIDIRNRGLWVPDAKGLARLRVGEEPAADELYCRCTPEFRAPAGSYDWLNRSVFVGHVDYPRPRNVAVDCFRLL